MSRSSPASGAARPRHRCAPEILASMSREDVELVQWFIDAWNRRDFEEFASKLSPDVDWVPAVINRADDRPEDEFRGIDGFWRWVAETDEVMGEFKVEAEEFRDLGDGRVLLLGRIRGRGRASGAEVSASLGQLITVRDGRAIAYRGYLDRREALEAAGLRE